MIASIGVDIGGTKIAAARVSASGCLEGEIIRVPTPRGGEAVLDAVAHLVREFTGRRRRPSQIGVASAGVIDSVGVVRASAATMLDWAGTDVRTGLRRRLGCDVSVVNDVQAVAVAEARFGAGEGFRRVLAVAVGTGIGGGLAVAGRLEAGASGIAGSVGHVVVASAEDERCTCGARAHAEALASGPALERHYAHLTASPPVSLREVTRRSAAGDVEAVTTITYGGMILGEALASAANVIDPDVIVVGGGVAEIGEPYLAPARAAFRKGAMPSVREVPIVAAALGVGAPLVGAVWC